MCSSVSAEADTVTVDMLNIGLVTDGEDALQPLRRLRPVMLAARSRSNSKRRRFLKLKKQRATASAAPGKNGLDFWRRDADAAVVVTVSVVEVAEPEGVTVVGEKLHAAPAGNPVQPNETVEAKPLCGVTVMVAVPLCPAVTVSNEGDAATVKSITTWLIAVEVLPAK
jgi:hypothetical protein